MIFFHARHSLFFQAFNALSQVLYISRRFFTCALFLYSIPRTGLQTANLYAGKTAALLRLLVHSVLAVELAVFLLLKTARSIFLFLRARIIPALAFRAFQYNNLTHDTSQYPCFDETAPPFS